VAVGPKKDTAMDADAIIITSRLIAAKLAIATLIDWLPDDQKANALATIASASSGLDSWNSTLPAFTVGKDTSYQFHSLTSVRCTPEHWVSREE
jgi:hypothetical protein